MMSKKATKKRSYGGTHSARRNVVPCSRVQGRPLGRFRSKQPIAGKILQRKRWSLLMMMMMVVVAVVVAVNAPV